MSDFSQLMIDEERVRRWNAESENADARLEIANAQRNCSFLISQHQPVERLGIDREKLRLLLAYIWHGDLGRLERDFAKLESKP